MYILKRFLGNEFEHFNDIINKYNSEQNTYINLTACVSYPFQEVLDVQAMPFATVPTEGTRGKRYFPSVNSLDEIENYAEELGLKLFQIENSSYKISIQPNSGTQANQIVYNAILKNGDTVLALSPKDGGHISHTKLGCRDIRPIYFSLDENMEINYESLEKQIVNIHPRLVIVGASSYVKEFDYQKIHSITSRYKVPLMADICHSVLYIMGNMHKNIFPFVDFATFTMDKLLCGPQGGILVYKSEYDSQINTSIFPKTQGGPIQNSLFAKAMCFLKLSSINIQEYAKTVIDNTNLLINELKSENIKVINDVACNHIILIDVTYNKITGKYAEEKLFKNGILANRNQIPNDTQNALITSGIRIGTVPITNLNYSKNDLKKIGKYLATIINGETPQKEIFLYLIEKYHNSINISS
ncbi:MAG: aminotransferase class I/II-fold pyridoxal phosphate-dependent enzyme [Lachnospiraceae bacterium]|nr:aminotransferase class I/II-fold pyridoxal phosphate-dependent enzyme [Lachnospiraceae bacterium]